MEALRRPVYPVGDGKAGIYDLLMRFADLQYRDGEIWRLSDLHLKVGEPAIYRFDEVLQPLPGGVRLTPEMIEGLVFPLLTFAQIERLRAEPPIDVDASFEIEETQLSFRISAFRDRDGLACAIRVLPRAVPAVTSVGFPDDRCWREIVARRQGLVLVTGMTGSGKSTTVASLLHEINRTRGVRIITLEDPIEYILHSERALISQREVGKHVAAFGDGLRSALREDPDIVFVGEMRDTETAALALTAAETGHLVFSTLHTRDARGTITRMIDMFPADRARDVATQLSFSLACVVAQKLVPRKNGGGRRLAMEVLPNLPAIANLIRSARWHQIYGVMEAHRKSGVITMERHLGELVARGEISREAALAFANDPTLIP